METFAWRYEPEFTLAVLINGQAATAMEVIPSALAEKALAGCGFITRTNGSTLTCFGRQLLSGTDWVPAYAITHPLSFGFWLRVLPESAIGIPGIFNDPAVMFGKPVFYANNLSASGEIDGGLAGNTLELIPDPLLIDERKGALSTHTPSAKLTPGEYTSVKAGMIRAGGAVDFYLSDTISPAQTEAGLDFRPVPGEVHMVVLDGSPDVREPVIPDEAALAAGVQGVVTIYKDAWRAPAAPVEYRINFIT